ncbi:unnamed protein product [Sphenostylis stenocarpa]|uniref:Uncharacterized protein n=1 Tax=Sphenostylis stenocarpa TaxID=92480 RepID=A0AA86W2S1_9FABA|nr:unnamed protein product [Sphenostylis stenocarpa]
MELEQNSYEVVVVGYSKREKEKKREAIEKLGRQIRRYAQPWPMKNHLIAAVSVLIDAQRQGLRIGVSSTVEYAVQNANVFLLERMGTSMSALATGTSSTRRASPNVLDPFNS